ncbi:hypothetical protein [Mycobacterium sp.]|uniref:hypothetical protein n=1 Tax=Mycobacterium sp. TaxID=1785 RepID=UPI00127F7C9E|nr:hypothetical protein [Mycobacterium sp.]KAA8969507.1 MAG: hypothetical protein F6Q13_03095 [Mycobacterium sp.]
MSEDRTLDNAFGHLASYRKCVERMHAEWPGFAGRRRQRLQQRLSEAAAEKSAENVLEDLFTTVLDWPLPDVLLQQQRADVVLSGSGFKRLVLEVKRPGLLTRHRAAIHRTLDQARRYAAEQSIGAVAVSDATMLYAADVIDGVLRDRALVMLDTEQPPAALWLLSVHGIYQVPPAPVVDLDAGPHPDDSTIAGVTDTGALLHPKYKLAMHCFAYVGAANDTRTWKLPYLSADGAIDAQRLPKAIQCIVSSYRGAKVVIPREACGEVMVLLATAAKELRKLPCQNSATATAYREAHRFLQQLDLLPRVGCCAR